MMSDNARAAFEIIRGALDALTPDERALVVATIAAAPTDDATRARIASAITASGGNLTRAARALGVARRTLYSRMRDLGMPTSTPGAKRKL